MQLFHKDWFKHELLSSCLTQSLWNSCIFCFRTGIYTNKQQFFVTDVAVLAILLIPDPQSSILDPDFPVNLEVLLI